MTTMWNCIWDDGVIGEKPMVDGHGILTSMGSIIELATLYGQKSQTNYQILEGDELLKNVVSSNSFLILYPLPRDPSS